MLRISCFSIALLLASLGLSGAQEIGGASGITSSSGSGSGSGGNGAPLGMNIFPGPDFTYYQPEGAFLNVWKMGSGWIPTSGSFSVNNGSGEGYCLSLDSNGDLTSLSPNGNSGCTSVRYTEVANIIFLNVSGGSPFYQAGVYDVNYTGTSDTWTWGGDATCTLGCSGNVGGSTGHEQITITTPSATGIVMLITAISGGNYAHNFSVTYAGACTPSTLTCTQIYQAGLTPWHPLYESFLSQMCQVRFMDAQNTNSTTVANYSDVVPETYAFWGIPSSLRWVAGGVSLTMGNPTINVGPSLVTYGVNVGTPITGVGIPSGDFVSSINVGAQTITLNVAPTETVSSTLFAPANITASNGVIPVTTIYKLGNDLRTDIWVNMPALATDAFATSFATTIFNGLKYNQNVYLEYVNEPWNFFTAVQGNMATAGNAFFAFSFTGVTSTSSKTVSISSVVNLYNINFSSIGVNVVGTCIDSTNFIVPGGVNQGAGTVTLNNFPTCNGTETISGPCCNSPTTALQYYSAWAPEMCTDWKNVFGASSGRVTCVLANQPGQASSLAQEAVTCSWINLNNVSKFCLHYYDAIAETWYLYAVVPPNFSNDPDGGLTRYFTEALQGGQIPPVTQTVTLSSSNTITLSDTSGLIVGMTVTSTGGGIPAGTTISGVECTAAAPTGCGVNHLTNVVTLNKAATLSDSETLTFCACPDGSSISDQGQNGLPFARIESDLAYIASHSWNLPIVGYEGSWFNSADTTSSAQNTLYTAANSDPRAQQVLQGGIQKWNSLGLGALNYYASIGDGQFGAIPNILSYNPASPASSSGKFGALYDYNTSSSSNRRCRSVH